MIGHDPHELAAYLSAVLQGYTRASAQAELERIFAAQYQLTLTEEVEVRYRTETQMCIRDSSLSALPCGRCISAFSS